MIASIFGYMKPPEDRLMQSPTFKTADKRAITIAEFCRAYSLSRSSFYKLKNAGKISTVHLAGRHLIPVEAAEALLNEGEAIR
jgi:hypothetical protein